jgi:RNA polymerase sigma-70 factor (ECF subfamily)
MNEFEALLVDLIPKMRQTSRALTRNRDSADDLVQATLERALQKKDLYQPTGPLIGWLNLIMRRIFIDQIRRNKIATMVPEEEFHETIGTSEAANQYDSRLLGEVRTLMADLSADAREILTTIGIEGRSYEEAATQLDVPMGTVRSRLFRARAALSAKMGDEPRSA